MTIKKEDILKDIAKFFKDNPKVSYKSFEEDVYNTFLDVQKESIKPYTPIKVEPINKNMNSFDTAEIHETTQSIFDHDI